MEGLIQDHGMVGSESFHFLVCYVMSHCEISFVRLLL